LPILSEEITDTMPPLPKQRVFSALEVAKICGVVNQTVINWIRAGHLRSSTTPGGQFRVYPDDLKTFLVEKGMKIPAGLQALFRQSGLTILIVEDDRVFNDLVKVQVQRMYPEAIVLQAFDGFEAGTSLGVKKPQVVLLDLNLPGVDGYELCRRIKDEPGFERPLVFAMTSSNEPGLEQRMKALGADAFFSKPIDFEALQSAFQKLLSW